MIKVTANINGEKREVTNYSYQCNLRFCDFPNFAQLIMIYKSVKCKEPPVEGDLITLTFNSTGKESFFYEWIISGDVYDGEIEFVCNEVDVVDIFRFWDCYCIGIEESMSIGGAPMSCTVYLSPGIIKRNNLPVREKVWKVSSPFTEKKVVDKDIQESNNEPIEKKEEKKEIQITEVCWKDANGEHSIDALPEDEIVTLWACTKNASPGDKISFIIKDDTGSVLVKVENCEVNSDGVAIVKSFQIERENSEKSLEETK